MITIATAQATRYGLAGVPRRGAWPFRPATTCRTITWRLTLDAATIRNDG